MARSRHSSSTTADMQVDPQNDEKCPACTPTSTQLEDSEKENWIRCDACKTWFHWRCVGNGVDVETIDKWYCTACTTANPSRTITFRAPTRKSTRKKPQLDYSQLNGHESDANRWVRLIHEKTIKHSSFRRMKGSEVGIEWAESDDNAMREPIIIETPEGLGLTMPGPDFTVDEVVKMVGPETPVEVIDVASQSGCPGWTMGKWGEYFNTDASSRDRIRNVISLEISGTELADQVVPPRLVRELDWVDKYWPASRKGKGHAYPKVQLYCLMGVANAWTDWHVDFAGSSVYYHIVKGAKTFYFIRPTTANLHAYERWSGSELQNTTWLGDMVDDVVKVELHQGYTMIIPTGWIHAVYTPEDTLVFGGNFLHSYNVATQLSIRRIEIATHVPKKFRFPYFIKLCWYVAEQYLRDLKAKEEFSPRVLESMACLADFLVSEVRTMEHGKEAAAREAKEQVPWDKIKDAATVARELRWRVRLASGNTSDDEGPVRPKKRMGSHTNGKAGSAEPPVVVSQDKFKNFTPQVWDRIKDVPARSDSTMTRAKRPAAEDDWDGWVGWSDSPQTDENGAEAEVESRKEVSVKVVKTDRGLKRMRIERVVETWSWGPEEGA